MNVDQKRQCRQQQPRQDNEEKDAPVAMEVDDACGTPPNTASQQRGSETAQGKQIEAGCVTARVENNNSNNTVSGSTTTASAGTSSSVQEQIQAVINRYVLHGKIDRGTFSTVTLATRRDEQHLAMDRRRMFAIKLITQTSHPTRIEREVRCMMAIGGQSNVVQIVDGFRHQGSVGLVMNYIPHEPFHVYYAQLSPAEVQRYIQQLLVALKRVHQFSVIHRDVKPSNFLHSRRNGGTFMLVDFGLAQEMRAGELTPCPPADKRKDSVENAKPAAVASPEPLSVERHKLPREGSGGAVVTTPNPDRDQVVFRNPLKQQQQQHQGKRSTISILKASKITAKDLVESPMSRLIKSAAISIGNGLKSRRSMALAAATPSPSRGITERCSERENVRAKDLDEPPLARQVKLAAAGVGAGLKLNRVSNAPIPSPSPVRQSSDLPWCECYGKAQVCNRCLVKRELQAPRAGTPGYRPPEVLLKYPEQTTAVDIWAAGVIFLSLLSKCYPFFGNTDDMTSLGQIISVFGYERIHETAHSLDRTLLVGEETMRIKALSLRRICQHFRALSRKGQSATFGSATAPSGGSSPPPGADDEGIPGDCCTNCVKPPEECLCQERVDREAKGANPADSGTDDCDEYGSAAYDLLERMLETDPHRRISAADALQHPYFEMQY